MKRSIPILLCLLFFVSSFQVFAQKGSKLPPVLKQQLDSSLYAHFQGQVPHHFCPCNNCEHWYNGKFMITKTGRKTRPISETEKEERIALWGKAGADQYSPFGSSQTTVQFYAEYVVLGEEYQLTLLKWKQSDCMQYLVLVDEPLKKMDDLSEDIADIEEEITNQILNAEDVEQLKASASTHDMDDQEGEFLDWAVEAEEGNLEGNESWEQLTDQFNETDSLKKESQPISTETAMVARMAGPTTELPNPTPLAEPTIKESPIESVVNDEMIEESIRNMADSLASASPIETDPAESDSQPFEEWEETEEEGTDPDPLGQLSVEQEWKEADPATLEQDPLARILSLSVHNPTGTKYKDAVIELKFVTKTETVLKTETHTIYEYFPGGETTSFGLEVSLPKYAQDVWVEVKELVEVE